MGQIIGGAAKPKRCNLNQLSQLGTPAAGEHILVSSDNSMNAAGQGNFDCYIVGDGRTAATALELKNVETLIGVFDISSYHATGGVLAKYADLTAALNDGNNIPQSLRKGGMSVKFVQSSDNKYVQYRLMSDTFNTTVDNWQGVDDELTDGSYNLVESRIIKKYVDNSDKALKNELPETFNTKENDLTFADENGKAIMQVGGGHIKTKNFDSQSVIESISTEQVRAQLAESNLDSKKANKSMINKHTLTIY